MISLGTRYIDYGLTGGLFIFAGWILLWLIYPGRDTDTLSTLKGMLSNDNAHGFETVLTGAVTSIGIVCVFATGLMLDLIGSVWIVTEAQTFRRYIKRNAEWIVPILNDYHLLLGDDLQEFLAVQNSRLKDFLRIRSIADLLKLKQQLSVAPQFSRLQTVLIAHLMIYGEPSRIEIVVDQLHTYRVAKSISAGMVILIAIFTILLCHRILFGPEIILRASLIFTYGILLPAMSISILVIQRAHSRFCASLFSFTFVVDKQRKSISTA